MSDDAATIALVLRADELARRVLGPLLLGGEMRPVRPLGPSVARRVAELAPVFQGSDSELMARCHEARVRRARHLAPVDQLPAMGAGEWLLLGALNDLMQAANPRLPSLVAPSRPRKLLAATGALLATVRVPDTLTEALVRHATLGRALEVHRTDTMVRWWTGSAQFHGEPPNRRLMAWPDVRRVQVTETPIGLEKLPLPGFPQGEYLQTLAQWLMLSPLTDLATAGRSEPAFRWSAATLGLVATTAGRRLARRALGGVGARGDVALEKATRELSQGASQVAFQVASRFLEDRRAHAALSS